MNLDVTHIDASNLSGEFEPTWRPNQTGHTQAEHIVRLLKAVGHDLTSNQIEEATEIGGSRLHNVLSELCEELRVVRVSRGVYGLPENHPTIYTSKRLEQALQSLDLRVEEAANRLGVPVETVRSWLDGEVMPTDDAEDVIQRIAEGSSTVKDPTYKPDAGKLKETGASLGEEMRPSGAEEAAEFGWVYTKDLGRTCLVPTDLGCSEVGASGEYFVRLPSSSTYSVGVRTICRNTDSSLSVHMPDQTGTSTAHVVEDQDIEILGKILGC